mgnify:CR=1 FL=1
MFAGRPVEFHAVELQNLNPPHSYTISGEGKGGLAGFAKGGADVSLESDGPSATVLTYVVKAEVGGKIAQLGQRLIDGAAKSLAEDFFRRFDEALQQRYPNAAPVVTDSAAQQPMPKTGGGMPSWAWAAIAAVVAVAIYLGSKG